MLINCNSCKKNFEVPDSAITENGRLLQCGTCGNKWVQYPIKENLVKKIKKVAPSKIKQPLNINGTKNLIKKRKRKINLYSEEYLINKHGLSINGPVNKKKINFRTGFGFYGYLATIIIFTITFFGILNLSKDSIVTNYPFTEPYIEYLYEAFNIIKIIFNNLIN